MRLAVRGRGVSQVHMVRQAGARRLSGLSLNSLSRSGRQPPSGQQVPLPLRQHSCSDGLLQPGILRIWVIREGLVAAAAARPHISQHRVAVGAGIYEPDRHHRILKQHLAWRHGWQRKWQGCVRRAGLVKC